MPISCTDATVALSGQHFIKRAVAPDYKQLFIKSERLSSTLVYNITFATRELRQKIVNAEPDIGGEHDRGESQLHLGQIQSLFCLQS